MDDWGNLDRLALGLSVVGFALAVIGSVLGVLSAVRMGRLRREAGLPESMPSHFRQRERLLEVLEQGPGSREQMIRLRSYARWLRSQRWLELTSVGMTIGQWGFLVEAPFWWWGPFAVAFTLFAIAFIVLTERNARPADTFLRRYPETEPMGDEATGDRGPLV
ncbi:hypothetical protein [Kineosporia sp. NBRC 101731]|uniref:hypothetical protein n=1 Tax=Kineosporia sp. NBRC 101731 TaxID=3032199 RepID=UPI0025555E25|nr:hypothetical protein [Kineosporia sp. NBRC 101731]